MENLKYIPFVVEFSAILLAFDIYFLIRWKNFTINRGWNRMIYIIPIVVGAFMLMISGYTVWIQMENIVPPPLFKNLIMLKSIWYLPKIMIIPFLAAFDLIRLGRKLFTGRGRNSVNKHKYLELKNGVQQHKILSEKSKKFNPVKDIQLIPEPQLRLEAGVPMGGEYDISHPDFKENDAVEPDNPRKTDSSRRKFLQTSGWALSGIPFLIISNGVVNTTYDFRVHEVDVPIKGLPSGLDGMKIAQITDVHAGSFHSPDPIRKAVNMINSLQPDLITGTGDFVNFNPDEFDLIGEEISKLKANIGIYSCLGNHDHFMSREDHAKLIRKLNDSGLNLLINEGLVIERRGGKINIAGIDNTGYGQSFGDLDKALANSDEKSPTILLCHDPTNWDRSIRKQRKVDLMLSGHTHGGQIGVEIFGNVYTPVSVAYKQFAGLYGDEDQYLYINRGLGTTGPPIRVGVSPEITLIKLRSKRNYS
ncbi:MAG: metallophosphoesterase [Candidatus Kapaibacterium sp.]